MLSILFALGLLASSCQAGSLSPSLANAIKKGGGNKDVMVDMNSDVVDGIVNHPAVQGLSGEEKTTKIMDMIKEQTKAEQQPIVDHMKSLGINDDQIEGFWGEHRISVTDVSPSQIQAIAAHPADFTVREPVTVQIVGIEKRQSNLQWGVQYINTTGAWNLGYEGQNVVVGVLDTGCFVQHVALTTRYLGTPYAWKDYVNGRTEPYDDNGHGTHCSGTVLGDQNGIGVAPKARLMCCKALNSQGSGSEAALIGCGQFFYCPAKDANGLCTGRPNIVSNSWGTAQGGQKFYNGTIDKWRKAGIIPIFAAGNSGPACGTLGSPGDQPDQIGVGSIDQDGDLSDFSSRGLQFVTAMKPDIAAPGRNIVSASNTNPNGYVTMSGTSMATPHVAGTVALLKSRNPSMTYQQVYNAITGTASQPNGISWLDACQMWPNYPNYGYGYGIINGGRAVAKN